MNADAAAIAALLAQDRATQALGITVDSVGDGAATFTMPVVPTMLNAHAVVHGGYIFTLADTAAAYVANAGGQRSVTSHSTVTYLAPARDDGPLHASATKTYGEGRQSIIDVVVRSAAGIEVAHVRCIMRTIAGTVFDPRSDATA